MSEQIQEKKFTQGDMENAKAMATVQTMLAGQREDFKEHTESDEKIFTELFTLIRDMRSEVSEIPKTVRDCRDQLELDMHKTMDDNYVRKDQFNKLIYTMGGIVLFGMFATWLISLFINVQKFAGG